MTYRLNLQGRNAHALTLAFELDRMSASCASGIPRLSVDAIVRRGPGWIEPSPPGMTPVILSLDGVLTSATSFDSLGAPLQPLTDSLPFIMPAEGEGALNLTFAMSDQFVHFFEDERQKQSNGDMRLAVRLTGIVALMAPDPTRRASLPSQMMGPLDGNVIGWRRLSSEPNPDEVRIPRSDWVGRFLPGLGYDRSVLIELPLTRTPPIPDALKQAVASLDAARAAFDHDDYRGALKYGREVLEHLGKLASPEGLTAFTQQRLLPAVGETKAKAFDKALSGVRDLTNAGAHANDFSPDRAIAIYLIETLALQLRYISAVVAF